MSGKIALLVVGVSFVFVSVGTAVYVGYERSLIESEVRDQMRLLARIIGRNSTAALAFEDPAASERILSALADKPSVVNAWILRADGSPFARYARRQPGEPAPGVDPSSDGSGRDSLAVEQRIELEGREIGTIRVLSDLREIRAWQRVHLAVGLVIGLGVVGVAVIVTWLLQRWISRPIEDLASLAQRVSDENRYDLRASRHSADEVGRLVDTFNDMLARIQRRDVELSMAKRVAEDAARQTKRLLEISRETNLELETEIREHRRAEEDLRIKTRELERSNLELNQFAYAASHDLQEPLRMVTMFTQLLQRRYGDGLDDSARSYIEFAVDGATRMRRLIQDLLEYSRAGRASSDLERVDCSQIVELVSENLSLAIAESGARIVTGDLPVVEANRTRILQLFQNLIANAIKFRSDRAPEIRIEAQHDAAGWLFSVRDNGIGIPEEFRRRIFMVFQRLHTRDEYDGTGIGLALCERIVAAHGGEIWVESEPGEGSSFLFTLPREQRTAREEKPEPEPCDLGAAGG